MKPSSTLTIFVMDINRKKTKIERAIKNPITKSSLKKVLKFIS
jgi:hypothetical protein